MAEGEYQGRDVESPSLKAPENHILDLRVLSLIICACSPASWATFSRSCLRSDSPDQLARLR